MNKPLPTPVPRPKAPPQQATAPQPAEPAADALLLAVETIFNSGNYSEVPLRDSRKVTILRAKTKHLSVISEFFRALIASLGEGQMTELIGIVSKAQVDALQMAGGDKGKLSTQLLIAASLGIDPHTDPDLPQMLSRGKRITSILLGLLSGAFVNLAPFASAFTSLSQEELEDLEVDEGVLVMTCVVMANYGFFTQTLPQIFRASLGAWATEQRTARPGS